MKKKKFKSNLRLNKSVISVFDQLNANGGATVPCNPVPDSQAPDPLSECLCGPTAVSAGGGLTCAASCDTCEWCEDAQTWWKVCFND